MRCQFCAEEIQDASSVCRFCGASKSAEGAWNAPLNPNIPVPREKGAFTIKLAGAFFLISGALPLAWVTSDVALLGAMRSGAAAVCYNLLFAALFLAIGVGLIVGKTWGYRLLFAGTVVYSIDRLAFLLHKPTRDAYLASGGMSNELSSLIDMDMVDNAVMLSAIVALGCWWGFALYIYARRGYFR